MMTMTCLMGVAVDGCGLANVRMPLSCPIMVVSAIAAIGLLRNFFMDASLLTNSEAIRARCRRRRVAENCQSHFRDQKGWRCRTTSTDRARQVCSRHRASHPDGSPRSQTHIKGTLRLAGGSEFGERVIAIILKSLASERFTKMMLAR